MTKSDVERIAQLETEVEHMTEAVKSMAKKVDEMHAVLLQAKGPLCAFFTIAGVIGFATSKLSAWIGAFPR